MLFSTGCSRAGIPHISLRGILGEYLSNISTYPKFWPSFSLQLQHSFYRILCCVARCCSGGLRNPLSEVCFHRRKDYFSWEISLEGSWAHFKSLASSQDITSYDSAVSVRNCVILEGSFRGVSIGSFRVFPFRWRVQPFIGGHPWGDPHHIYNI